MSKGAVAGEKITGGSPLLHLFHLRRGAEHYVVIAALQRKARLTLVSSTSIVEGTGVGDEII